MEALPGLVKIHVLSPPTLPALRQELDRARTQKQPYHVVHFDGHGVYDPKVGLGGLCFELPEDAGSLAKVGQPARLERRRHVTVFTDELGPLLRDHRIPLVFLEACQTAHAEKASESVASELLKVGVASVVAMSHSVLVETARRFVETFYQALAAGRRVGDAMLEGQRRLKDDTFRGRIFGAGELRLEDWFVPVLFQEKDDPQLFRTTPSATTVEDFQVRLKARLGELPAPPATGFVGRSRELLALQRLLSEEGYAVVRGQGGEGKTALAAEFARWMVRSQQMHRAAFVSVELNSNVNAVLDALGRQLVGGDYSVAAFADQAQAILPVERVLAEQPTLLVIDNMESILLPPYVDTAAALSEDAKLELDRILSLCKRLNAKADIVFTSREALPAPFDGERHRRELHQLDRDDAVKLVERALNADESMDAVSSTDATLDARREAIEALVDAVHCHARTLALLAPDLQLRGVDAMRAALVELMATMERQFPGSREKSLYASVELSLRRLSPANRDRVNVLGVFQGGVDLDVLRVMMEWERADVGALAGELVATGLATPNRYNHLTLNPALCPYLRGRMEKTECAALTARWIKAMREYVYFLAQQRSQNAEVAATLTVLELPNLFALLELVQRAGDAAAMIDLATSLYSLLQPLGKARLLERVWQVRDAAATTLGDAWNHAQFEAARTRIEQLLQEHRLREAFEGAQNLLLRAREEGGQAYTEANYDLAMAFNLLGQVMCNAGRQEQALLHLDEALQLFEAVAKDGYNDSAKLMAAVCFGRRGHCLLSLGRLDEAATAYEERIRRGEQLGDNRGVAAGKAQLGSVRMQQRRYPEAIAAFADAREKFTQLDEPGSVAASWHQTGTAYGIVGQAEAAEDAYRKALAIMVRIGNVDGQAATLVQLGNLYDDVLDRPEEAAAFYRLSADVSAKRGDLAKEGMYRSNLAATLGKLRRTEEARAQILRAIECGAPFGHASGPWKSWDVLAAIETDADNLAAAAEAKRKAIACYLAYRRDGGENHHSDGRISHAVTQALLAGEQTQAASLLQQLADSPEAKGSFLTFIRALQAIVTGSRDCTLADAPELKYTMAAELLFLLETLAKTGT
ncbi:MAG: CHAT domain-containing protein [Planctomycetes bacterium]|nr:CHAT domain-containing protein [Planctomycetota bacterium]